MQISFWKAFYQKKVFAVPLPNNVPLDIKSKIMDDRKCILERVKRYIDAELNPRKNNFFDNTRDDFKESMSIYQILQPLEITKFEFEQTLFISEDDSFQIQFKRVSNSRFVIIYFSDGLKACIQLVQGCSIFVCIPIKD